MSRLRFLPFHLLHGSLEFSDSRGLWSADLDYYLTRGADVATFTEVVPDRADLFRDLADRHGYAAHAFVGGSGIAVRRGRQAKAIHWHSRRVLAPRPGLPRDGGRPARNVDAVTFQWRRNMVTVATAHWPAHLTDNPEEAKGHDRLTRAWCEELIDHSRRRHLAWGTGDVNDDHGPDDLRLVEPEAILRRHGIATIYAEVGGDPAPTHGRGRTIDWIARPLRDERVQAETYRIHPPRHSDHRAVSAHYLVRMGQGTVSSS